MYLKIKIKSTLEHNALFRALENYWREPGLRSAYGSALSRRSGNAGGGTFRGFPAAAQHLVSEASLSRHLAIHLTYEHGAKKCNVIGLTQFT